MLPRYHLAWTVIGNDHPASAAVSVGNRPILQAPQGAFGRAAPGRWLTEHGVGLAPYPDSLGPWVFCSLPHHGVGNASLRPYYTQANPTYQGEESHI